MFSISLDNTGEVGWSGGGCGLWILAYFFFKSKYLSQFEMKNMFEYKK
jgi:hypothetical protein